MSGLVFRRLQLLTAALLLSGGSSVCAQDARSDRSDGLVPMGMNLAGVTDWSTAWPFVDVFKHSRGWIAQRVQGDAWDTGERIETTADGWPLLRPGQAAATLMLREISPHYPGGRYVCTYEGTGRIEFGFAATVAERQPGRIELDVRHDEGGIYLKIVESDRADPVRDIKVWMPGFEGAESPFHPLWLERLRPFGVIRFMDWQRTNADQPARWEDRATPESARQSTDRGVAIEHMVAVANELGADPWFCMPHRADDEYVREFARLVERTLHADATVYVEYSNEVWNGMFPSHAFIGALAEREGLHHPQATADRAARVFSIWREVFADEPERVVRVAAGQHYNPWIAETMCDRLNGEFDAIAVAAYFSYRDEDARSFGERTTVEDLLLSARKELEERGIPLLRRHAELADEWSERTGREIRLIAYEGGQHISAWGRTDLAYYDEMRAAQTHPRMVECYERLLDAWDKMGGDVFCAFSSIGNWGRGGYWGHLEYQDQPLDKAPKYGVLVERALVAD